MTELPSCKDFILAAVRKLRVNHYNQSENTAAGVGVKKVWKVAQYHYTAQQVADALNELVGSKTILLTAKILDKKTRVAKTETNFVFDESMLTDSLRLFSDDKKTCFSEKPEHEPNYSITEIIIYIIEDRLPKRVLNDKGKNLADSILAGMKTS